MGVFAVSWLRISVQSFFTYKWCWLDPLDYNTKNPTCYEIFAIIFRFNSPKLPKKTPYWYTSPSQYYCKLVLFFYVGLVYAKVSKYFRVNYFVATRLFLIENLDVCNKRVVEKMRLWMNEGHSYSKFHLKFDKLTEFRSYLADCIISRITNITILLILLKKSFLTGDKNIVHCFFKITYNRILIRFIIFVGVAISSSSRTILFDMFEI